MRITPLLLLVVMFLACKTRDPASAGLLASSEPEASQSGEGQDFAIDCSPSEDDARPVAYQLDVFGATSGPEQDLPLTVTVAKLLDGNTVQIADHASGSGVVSTNGSIVVSFASGVLSVDRSQSLDAHIGVLTLLDQDDDAEGVPVRCRVALKASRG